MKTRAAVLRKAGTPGEITAGLCHSDEHIRARGLDEINEGYQDLIGR